MTIICLVVVIFITLFAAFRPDIVWQLIHRVHVQDGTPTKASLTAIRIGGIVLTVTAIILLVLTIIYV